MPSPALPRLIGHRGAAAYAPENTLASIRKAAALGARWVEFDVRLTRDGALVLLHDDTLGRTAGHPARLRDVEAAALAALDAGAWFGKAFAGERVPTLRAAIATLAELRLGANIEIKAVPGDAAATARALAVLLDEAWPATLPPPLVSSFEIEALAAIQEAAPHWPRGLLLKRLEGDWRGLLDRLDAATLNLDHKPLTAASVAAACAAGRPVLCYTVNDPARARALFDWGVTGIFSDRPDLLDGG